MKNNVTRKAIMASILFICSYTQSIVSFEGLPERERKMSPTQIDQLEQMLTPLHFAQTEKQVTELLKYGPDINAQDVNGVTPIQYMINNGNISAIMTMKEHGAKMSREDQIAYINLLKQECIYKTRK